MVGQLLDFEFCVVGLISLIWTLWFWCVFGFEFGVLCLVEECLFKCCGFTFAELVWVLSGVWVAGFVCGCFSGLAAGWRV